MRAVRRFLGTLLVIVSVVALALLALGPLPTDTSETKDLPENAQFTATPGPPTQAEQGVTPVETLTAASPGSTPTPAAGLDPGQLVLDDQFVDNRLHWPSDPQSTAWVV